MTTYSGGCHCGRVAFEVSGTVEKVLKCNCSICRMKGMLHWIVAPTQFKLVSGQDALECYRFGTRKAQHLFCRHCGISSYYIARSHPDKIDINLRCIPEIDLDLLEPAPFDGQNWDVARATLDAEG